MELEISAGPRVRAFAMEIAHKMVELFSITNAEAVGRINRHWRHVPEFHEEMDQIFRESPTYWAKTIYYGKDSYWWKGEDALVPLPYP